MRRADWQLLILFIFDRLIKNYFSTRPSWAQDGFLTYTINSGIAFSFPVWHFLFWPIWIFLILVAFYYLVKSRSQDGRIFFAWGLLLVGALSNVMDRINHGGVIDYLRLPYFSIINLSDVYIFMGVVALIIFGRQKRALDA